MRKLIAILAALHLAASPVYASLASTAPALLKNYPASQRKVIEHTTFLFGVRLGPDGSMRYPLRDPLSGETKMHPLSVQEAARLVRSLARMPQDNPEQGLTDSLISYLKLKRETPEAMAESPFLEFDDQGRLKLTAAGRRALFSILIASDGQLLESLPKKKERSPVVWSGADGTVREDGRLNALARREFAGKAPNAAFDGRRHELGSFDWNSFGTAVAVLSLESKDGTVPAGGRGAAKPGRTTGAVVPSAMAGYAVNKEKGTVRILIAAERAGGDHLLGVRGTDEEKAAVYRQFGLDAKLFREYGAKLVRTVDNVVAVDVPLPSAALLGRQLKKRGIESRPARRFISAARRGLASPAAALLGGQFLPIPSDAIAAAGFGPKLADVSNGLDVGAFHRRGVTGKGRLMGVIDSGIDLKHEDFKDENGYSRVRSYLDFTEEGKDDVIGHGTHVAGIMGGNGAESDGKYTGMAPGANFKIAKVFGTKGETDESVILAAMKWMRDEKSGKVDVINMSLGGPGTANQDPLSSMANQLMVKDDILVVTAAGNEGPFPSSIGSPGNARYGLTVGGVDKKGVPVFFSSRGPVRDAQGNPIYSGVDLVAYSGDVDLTAIQQQIIMVDGKPVMVTVDPKTGKLAMVGVPNAKTCVYGPGIVAPASSADTDQICRIDGNPSYRKMSGTSQATPQAAGIAVLIEEMANRSGVDPSAFEVKAVMMETARSVGHRRETEGAGLINGRRIADTVMDRVKRGIPIGNIAYMLAMRLTSSDLEKLPRQNRYQMTDLGLLDTSTGYLVKDEFELDRAIREIRAVKPLLYVKKREVLRTPSGPIPV